MGSLACFMCLHVFFCLSDFLSLSQSLSFFLFFLKFQFLWNFSIWFFNLNLAIQYITNVFHASRSNKLTYKHKTCTHTHTHKRTCDVHGSFYRKNHYWSVDWLIDFQQILINHQYFLFSIFKHIRKHIQTDRQTDRQADTEIDR